ncbi:MAG: o-succinylbenzoate--CoA ligase [Thermomicrobiales bacterium]|nr:o-succinylbenzoate--CoA ligase [Thermomicrobiales bacterium]
MPDWLGRRALLDGERQALTFEGMTWTWAELDRRVGLAAGRLRELGVTEGDRVALLADNSPEFVVAVHAVGRLGATLVPLNVRLTPPELAWQLADSGARLLLHDERHAREAAAAGATAGVRQAVFRGDWTEGAGESIPAPDSIELNRAQGIVYTSGTTGRPKGAMITYGNLWASATGAVLHLGHHRDDRWLAVLPLFHVGGLSILFRSAIGGVPVVLQDGFDPGRVNRAIDDENVTLVSAVANTLQRMLDERGDRPFPPSLRCVLLGGGPAPRPLLERCLRLGAPVAPTYGLTESTSQAATLLPEELAGHLGSAGRALPVTEIRIERDGEPVPAGEHGEIAVRGATVVSGYLNQERPGDDGWFRTGDLGWMDVEGYLFVLDRRDDLIVSGGENVYPAEIESVLLAHPVVAEAAVVGLPDDRWGAVPAAFLVKRPGVDGAAADVLSFCAERLAAYKLPRRIEWVERLPRNAGGKLLRRRLRDESG